MDELAGAELDKLCWDVPPIGLAVIVVSSQNNRRYRAAIQDVLPTECRVFYVDYGHTEIVPYDQIFEVPRTFLHRPTFAYRMQLSGWTQTEPITQQLKVWFEQLLRRSDDLLMMVISAPSAPGEQLSAPHVCKLFDHMHSVDTLLTNEKWNLFDVVMP